MKHLRLLLLASAVPLVLAGCASRGGVRKDSGALAYAVPAVNPAVYAYSDTTRMDMDFAAVDLAARGTVELAFEPAAEGLRAMARWTEFDGVFASPNGRVRADASGIEGALVLGVDGRGRVEVVEAPRLSASMREVVGGPASMARVLFIRLPGRMVEPGATWIDTVRVAEESEGLSSMFEAVVTSTWAGDTAVAGRTLRVIRTRGVVTLDVQGVTQGIEVRQRLTGESNGTALWDAERRLLVAREEDGVLNGTMELPAMGMRGIAVRSRSRTRLALQEE
jgi:hypothetical protein